MFYLIFPLLCVLPLFLIALFIAVTRGPDFPYKDRLRFALYTGLGATCVGLAYAHSTGPSGFISYEPASQVYGWPWPWLGYVFLGNVSAPMAFAGDVLVLAAIALVFAWLADRVRPRLTPDNQSFASGVVVILVLLVPLSAVLLRDVRLPPLAFFQPPPLTPAPVDECMVDLVPAVDEPGRNDVRVRTTAHMLEVRTYTFVARFRLREIKITKAFAVGDHPLEFVFPSNELGLPPPVRDYVLIFADNNEHVEAAMCWVPGYTLEELGVPTPTHWPPAPPTETQRP